MCVLGLPWWLTGKESTCQCRRYRFNPWSGKTPHDTEQLSPHAIIIEPTSRARKPQLLSPGATIIETCKP